MTTTAHPTGTDRGRRRGSRALLAAITAGVVLAVLVAVAVTPGEETVFDTSLPNPMGGQTRHAPGVASGQASLEGLVITDTAVAMGDVALGITYVPSWEVTNPTDGELVFMAGQPQVIEGCCPGPVYADGELTQAGQRFIVPPGGSVLLQFPLQMHPGMDGPHHLVIPLEAGREQAVVQVTGNFTDTVSTG